MSPHSQQHGRTTLRIGVLLSATAALWLIALSLSPDYHFAGIQNFTVRHDRLFLAEPFSVPLSLLAAAVLLLAPLTLRGHERIARALLVAVGVLVYHTAFLAFALLRVHLLLAHANEMAESIRDRHAGPLPVATYFGLVCHTVGILIVAAIAFAFVWRTSLLSKTARRDGDAPHE